MSFYECQNCGGVPGISAGCRICSPVIRKYIGFTRTHPDAIIPTYATDGSACFDLYAYADQTGHNMVVDTGLAFEIPAGYMMRIESRSGLGFKHGVAAFHGIVDSDYRGSVRVLLYQFVPSYEDIVIRRGDRIAQAWLAPCEMVSFVEVGSLSETGRGDGGFGSTGR